MVRWSSSRWPVHHLIVVVQQSRTFDDLFAGYSGADAPTFGCAKDTRARLPRFGSGCPSGDSMVPLKQVAIEKDSCKRPFPYADYFRVAWDSGAMDGWSRLDRQRPFCPYTRVRRSDSRPYWLLARRFAIADDMFSSTHFGVFADQLYLIAGTSMVARNVSVVGPPIDSPWSCQAPPGSRTAILVGGRIRNTGPFPCFTQFPTMAGLFDRAGVSWKYYYDAPGPAGVFWNPFEAIKYVAEGPDWTSDMSSPATNVLSDITSGALADVSWVLSPYHDSDAPGTSGGPAWVYALFQAVNKSKYWSSSAILVVWDDAGDGTFYDNAPPPQLDLMGLGFRVPLILVSKYARRSFVSHTQYEFGSILKFIEQNWNLPYLGGSATDQRANSISNMFSFEH
jgi:phospholipase C